MLLASAAFRKHFCFSLRRAIRSASKIPPGQLTVPGGRNRLRIVNSSGIRPSLAGDEKLCSDTGLHGRVFSGFNGEQSLSFFFGLEFCKIPPGEVCGFVSGTFFEFGKLDL